MENNKLEEKLNIYEGERVIINILGFLQSQYTIENLKYNIEYEILNIEDEETDNYIKINLNQIYKIDEEASQIKLYLDNDIIIILSI